MGGLRRAEEAIFRRAELACAAATAARLPGRFEARRHGGLLTVRVTDPALAFLTTIRGVSGDSQWRALELLGRDPRAHLVLPADAPDPPGCRRGPGGVLAVMHPSAVRADPRAVAVRRESDPDAFIATLLAGYESYGALADYLAAEHSASGIHRFLAYDGEAVLGAAAMSVHGDVAVLGGASTLPGRRGMGAQSALLGYRLASADALGCTLAVATAAPDSASERNLARAGFRIHRRVKWSYPELGDAAPRPTAHDASAETDDRRTSRRTAAVRGLRRDDVPADGERSARRR